jgi:hypothetical protein
MSTNMCAASVIYDYGSRIPPYKWTTDGYDRYKEIIDKAKEWDKIMDQPGCDDEVKADWMKLVEDILRKRKKMIPEEVNINDCPRLEEALDLYRSER